MTEIKSLTVEEKIDFLHGLIMSNQEKIRTLEQGENTLFKGIESLHRSLDEFRDDTSERFDRLEDKIDGMETKMESLVSDLKSFIVEELPKRVGKNLDEKFDEHRRKFH